MTVEEALAKLQALVDAGHGGVPLIVFNSKLGRYEFEISIDHEPLVVERSDRFLADYLALGDTYVAVFF